MGAAVLEMNPRAGYQILYHRAYEDLVLIGLRGNAGGDVDGYPPDAVLGEFDLSGVEADPDTQSERADSVDNRQGAPDGTPGPVERDQEAVSRRVDLPAAKPAKLVTDDVVVTGKEVSPAPIT